MVEGPDRRLRLHEPEAGEVRIRLLRGRIPALEHHPDHRGLDEPIRDRVQLGPRKPGVQIRPEKAGHALLLVLVEDVVVENPLHSLLDSPKHDLLEAVCGDAALPHRLPDRGFDLRPGPAAAGGVADDPGRAQHRAFMPLGALGMVAFQEAGGLAAEPAIHGRVALPSRGRRDCCP